MIRVVLAPFIFVFHTFLQITNLAFWGMLIIILGLVKLVMPNGKIKTFWNKISCCSNFLFSKLEAPDVVSVIVPEWLVLSSYLMVSLPAPPSSLAKSALAMV